MFESTNLGSTWESLTYNMNATAVTSIQYAAGNLYVTTYGEGFLEWPHFPIAPLQPQSFAATSTPSQVKLTWSVPSFDGGSGITGYKLYRGASAGNVQLLATLTAQTSYVDTSVSPGASYVYNLTAVNAVGASMSTGLGVSVPLATTASSTTSSTTATSTSTSAFTNSPTTTVTETSTSSTASTPTGTSTSSSTTPAQSSTSTGGAGGIPEFPNQVFVTSAFVALIAVSYLLVRRREANPTPGLGR